MQRCTKARAVEDDNSLNIGSLEMALGALERGDLPLQQQYKEVLLGTAGSKVIDPQVPQKKLDHGQSRSRVSNKRTNSPSATLQAKRNTSPAKHPVDYKRVHKRSLLGCHQVSLLLIKKEVPSPAATTARGQEAGGPSTVQIQ